MGMIDGIDFGPLAGLVGRWTGDEGTDIAPEPDGDENNPYFEAIEFSVVGDVTNAEKQTLAVLHYRQIVQRKSNNDVFHDQTGYWIWDAEQKTVMHAFTIPRGIAVLAGGQFDGDTNAPKLTIDVASKANSDDFGISQSPFMRDNAKTVAFDMQLVLEGDSLNYKQNTRVKIYDKLFDHTDENRLTRA